ncbi:hypothetical protein WKR88_09175 [Trinickia caryophylli]|uniref:Uncharacterized protein n=1 Tax=Trinickia caryophylli TaxID=28094 RepID=A0A1X7EAU2_TRICW|nr:hypothetical protein [Trinickia caryophylli]TRX14731.1 hypothetical protein FNF07_26165 [Trinickia caryophylli]WQE14575.1 hypothetical protein U0034_28350 [Trinickia caryophylli]GLU32014.1 hypothetical protein Busp01_18560 [Trinickia caryophylli]SMF30562.1 hypothetical protein SAMN06295900_105129 [Trinickia caryophylli]
MDAKTIQPSSESMPAISPAQRTDPPAVGRTVADRAWLPFFDTGKATPVEQIVDGETYLIVDAATGRSQRTLLMEGDEPYMGSRATRAEHLFAIGFERNAQTGRRTLVIYRDNAAGHFHVRGQSTKWNWVFWADKNSSTPPTEWQINWHEGGQFTLVCEVGPTRMGLCARPGQPQWLFAGDTRDYKPLHFLAYSYRSRASV